MIVRPLLLHTSWGAKKSIQSYDRASTFVAHKLGCKEVHPIIRSCVHFCCTQAGVQRSPSNHTIVRPLLLHTSWGAKKSIQSYDRASTFVAHKLGCKEVHPIIQSCVHFCCTQAGVQRSPSNHTIVRPLLLHTSWGAKKSIQSYNHASTFVAHKLGCKEVHPIIQSCVHFCCTQAGVQRSPSNHTIVRPLLLHTSWGAKKSIQSYNHASTFVAHKLSKVTLSRVVDHLNDAPQAPNFGSMVVLLKKPETPIWKLVWPTTREERVMEVCWFVRAHHAVVFILPSAVIYVEERHFLTEPMCLQEKVKPTDNVVCTFATLSSLVSEKVDLVWEGTVHFLGFRKVNRSWLEGIR